MSSGKVLLGLLAGAATGALLGVLFAPEKGVETRKKITKKGEDYADSLKKHFGEFIDSISEKYEKVEEKVTGFTENMKANTEETVKDKKAAKS